MIKDYLKTSTCVVCERSFSVRKYNSAAACSPTCRGLLQRQKEETKYKLDAFSVWNSSMAYALGLVFSDGNITKGPQGSWRLQFVSTDKGQTQWFHSFVGNPNKIVKKTPKQRTVCGVKLKKKPKTQFVSISVSDTIVKTLIQWGIRPRKSHTGNLLRIPPKPYIKDFLRGVCDGDGSIMMVANQKMPGKKTLRASLTCYPEGDRSFLSNLLMEEKVPHTVTSKGVRMDGPQAETFCKVIYKNNARVRLDRKYQVWANWRSLRSTVGGLVCEKNVTQRRRYSMSASRSL